MNRIKINLKILKYCTLNYFISSRKDVLIIKFLVFWFQNFYTKGGRHTIKYRIVLYSNVDFSKFAIREFAFWLKFYPLYKECVFIIKILIWYFAKNNIYQSWRNKTQVNFLKRWTTFRKKCINMNILKLHTRYNR